MQCLMAPVLWEMRKLNLTKNSNNESKTFSWHSSATIYGETSE